MSEDRAGRRERADTPRRRVRATHVLVRTGADGAGDVCAA